MLRCAVVDDMEESDPAGLSSEERDAGPLVTLGEGGNPCTDCGLIAADPAGSTICGCSVGVLLLLFLDFLDTLRAASCAMAISSLSRSSSSLVFRRPRSRGGVS